MREDIRLEDWRIWADGPFQDDFLESIFFCGGGRMGVRGYAAGDPRPRPVQQGLFLAGMFDEIRQLKPGRSSGHHSARIRRGLLLLSYSSGSGNTSQPTALW